MLSERTDDDRVYTDRIDGWWLPWCGDSEYPPVTPVVIYPI
jgi:hypothetical protein